MSKAINWWNDHADSEKNYLMTMHFPQYIDDPLGFKALSKEQIEIIFNIRVKSDFYTDVKSFIGGIVNGRWGKIGYDITRVYYDSKEKNCFIGEWRIKRFLYK